MALVSIIPESPDLAPFQFDKLKIAFRSLSAGKHQIVCERCWFNCGLIGSGTCAGTMTRGLSINIVSPRSISRVARIASPAPGMLDFMIV